MSWRPPAGYLLDSAAFRHERSFRLARLPEEPRRHRGHARPHRPVRATSWSPRPRTPRSSSSTPAASSARPSRSRSTPSSRWRATRRPAPASAWSSPAACRSATRAELADEMPEVDHFLGTGEVGDDRRARSPARAERVHVAETPRLPLRRRGAAPAVDGGAHRVRQDRRGLRSPVRVLHHPQAARPAAQPRCPSRSCARRATLVAGGAEEICLVAQDLTTYGTDLPGREGAAAPRRWRRCCARWRASTGCAGSACTTPIRPRAPTSCST